MNEDYLRTLAKEVAIEILFEHGQNWQWDVLEDYLEWNDDYSHLDGESKETLALLAAEYTRGASITITLEGE